MKFKIKSFMTALGVLVQKVAQNTMKREKEPVTNPAIRSSVLQKEHNETLFKKKSLEGLKWKS